MAQIIITNKPRSNVLGTLLEGLSQGGMDAWNEHLRQKDLEEERRRWDATNTRAQERHEAEQAQTRLERQTIARDIVRQDVEDMGTEGLLKVDPAFMAAAEREATFGAPEVGPPATLAGVLESPKVTIPGIEELGIPSREVDPVAKAWREREAELQQAGRMAEMETDLARRNREAENQYIPMDEAALNTIHPNARGLFRIGETYPRADVDRFVDTSLTDDQAAARAGKIASAQYNARIGAEQRAQAAEEERMPGLQEVIPPEHQGLTGQEYLDTLTPAVAAQIKSIVEGRASLDKIASLRKHKGDLASERRRLHLMALQYDPTFDQTVWATRNATRRDFANSKSAPGRAINAANTLIRHLGQLNKSVDKLNNTDFRILNRAWQEGLNQIGDPRLNPFLVSANGAAGELAMIFKGGNAAPTKEEIAEARKVWNPFSSPQQLRAGIEAAVEAMRGRLDTHAYQWEMAMGSAPENYFLFPKSIKTMQEMGLGELVGLTGEDLTIEGPMVITEED